MYSYLAKSKCYIQLIRNEYKLFGLEGEGISEFCRLAEADFLQYRSNINTNNLGKYNKVYFTHSSEKGKAQFTSDMQQCVCARTHMRVCVLYSSLVLPLGAHMHVGWLYVLLHVRGYTGVPAHSGHVFHQNKEAKMEGCLNAARAVLRSVMPL